MAQVFEFITQALWNSFALALGLGVVFGLLYMVLQLQLAMWRKVAALYAGEFEQGTHPSRLAGAVAIAERGIRWGYTSNQRQNVYPPVRVTILPDGIGLKVMWPLNYGSGAIFLPFAEMELASTKWALWGDPVAIRMKRAGNVDIILYRHIMEWAAEQSPRIASMMVQADPRLREPVVN